MGICPTKLYLIKIINGKMLSYNLAKSKLRPLPTLRRASFQSMKFTI